MVDELIEWCERQVRNSEDIVHEEDDANYKKVHADMAGRFKETAQALRELQSLREENERLRGKYSDLLYQVAQKVPGESRHDTAKRIIYQHENRPDQSPEQGENPITNPNLLRQEEI